MLRFRSVLHQLIVPRERAATLAARKRAQLEVNDAVVHSQVAPCAELLGTLAAPVRWHVLL
jgi:hypothetical protein